MPEKSIKEEEYNPGREFIDSFDYEEEKKRLEEGKESQSPRFNELHEKLIETVKLFKEGKLKKVKEEGLGWLYEKIIDFFHEESAIENFDTKPIESKILFSKDIDKVAEEFFTEEELKRFEENNQKAREKGIPPTNLRDVVLRKAIEKEQEHLQKEVDGLYDSIKEKFQKIEGE